MNNLDTAFTIHSAVCLTYQLSALKTSFSVKLFQNAVKQFLQFIRFLAVRSTLVHQAVAQQFTSTTSGQDSLKPSSLFKNLQCDLLISCCKPSISYNSCPPLAHSKHRACPGSGLGICLLVFCMAQFNRISIADFSLAMMCFKLHSKLFKNIYSFKVQYLHSMTCFGKLQRLKRVLDLISRFSSANVLKTT